MIFVPNEIDAVMVLCETREHLKAMFFGAAHNIICVACIECAVAAACNDIGVEHYANIWGVSYVGKCWFVTGSPPARG